MRKLAALAAVLVAATACGGPEPPEGRPSLVGVIAEREGGGFSVRQRGEEANRCGAGFGASDETRVLIATEIGRYVEADPNDLAVGQRIRLWSDHPVLTICPLAYIAETVVVTGPSSD